MCSLWMETNLASLKTSTEHLIKTDLVAISYQSSCGHSCSKFTIFIHESKKFGTKVMVVAKQLSK